MEENQVHLEGNEEKVIQVRLRWGSDAGLDTVYVNHAKITHSGPEFYILFGELVMPIIVGEEYPEEMVITPKVRLAISPDQMIEISKVIQTNCEHYLEKKNGGSDITETE